MLNAPDMAGSPAPTGQDSGHSGRNAPKAVAGLEAGFEDAMAVMAPTEKYRKRLRAPICRNGSTRKSTASRAGDHLSRRQSTLRLIGALLAEYNELAGTAVSLDMDEFAEWAAAAPPPAMATTFVALAG